jgi:hypothetical protein
LQKESIVNRKETFEQALALDPNFERIDTKTGTVIRRVEGSSLVTPWTTTVSKRPGRPDQVSFTTAIEGATVKISVESYEGEVGPHKIEIEMDDGSPLPPKVFTQLRLKAILDQMNSDLKMPIIRFQLGMFDGDEWREPFLRRVRSGRKGRPDWEYALWAERYEDALAEDRRKPIELLMKKYPGHGASMIRSILHKARQRGLLTPSPQKGLAGGYLTPKGQKVLDKHRSPSSSSNERNKR